MPWLRLLPLGLLLIFLLGGCALPRLVILNDPLDARQHNDLGVAYQQKGEADLAVREYERAAELDSAWARPLINRGNVQAGRGQWRTAEKSYRQALRREPGNAEAMNNLAWVLLKGEEPEAALEWAQQALAAAPDNPAFLDTLAEIQIVRRDYAAARLAVERALQLSPSAAALESLQQKLSLLDSLGAR